MIRRARRAFEVASSLRTSELAGLVPAAVVVRLVRLSLQVAGSARTVRWLRRVPQRRSPRADVAHFRRHARVVQLAGNHGPFKATCLPQSLTMWAWLRWNGADAEVIVGVPIDHRADHDEFMAHAWLEWAGEPVTDLPETRTRFVAFERALTAS